MGCLTVLLVALCWVIPVRAQSIYFDDSDPTLIVLGNSFYEIGFRKSNGGIAYITDQSTGQDITLGSRYECLWGAVFPEGTPDYVGGCSYNAEWPGQFTYTWAPTTDTLTFHYTPDPASLQQVTAQVTVTASDDAWFDMRLELENDWGHVLDYILFPSDLVFGESDIEEVLLPILPGVMLEPAFFEQNRSYTAKYPGYPGLFADYVSVSSTSGNMAIYSLYGQGPLRPLVTGLIHDDEYLDDTTFYYHTFGVGIEDGETWTTPQVRVHVSQPHQETINAYRLRNGLRGFPALTEKLGSRYDHVVRSPLLKADADQLRIPFSDYSTVLSQVPTPGILHSVAFQPGGHDESYPDFLPPDPSWGTTADFAAMAQDAQGRGLLVMPYTNPTWWDDESPTLQDPPVAITDVAVIDDQGKPVYEYYGPHGGYVMSPHPPLVKQRLQQLVMSMTEDIPSDILFEDQIGARPWLFDHNSSSPYPMAYIPGWLEHTRTHSDTLLMTELGFDRLTETEVGFHGSVLLPERLELTDDWWGAGTWHPYPLAPMMARDKVLFYQHDLAPETFTVDRETLTWNLAFGYMLSYDLVESSFGGGLDSEWLGLVSAFQEHALSHYADERVTNFTNLGDEVTQTTFESHSVVANWDEVSSYTVDDHTLSPSGAILTSDDGSLTAGAFTNFNGVPLSPGDHYLIENRGWNDICVRQPIGADTDLTLDLLPGWAPGDPITVWAYAHDGRFVGRVPVTTSEQEVCFTYRQQVAGESVAYYRVFRLSQVFLPVVLRERP